MAVRLLWTRGCSRMAEPRQIVDIPLAGGLDTKTDEKALQPPGLTLCEDAQFDDIGGMQQRPQYQAITDAAGNTIDDIRKIVPYADQLVAFSKDKIWSYASSDGLWTDRGDYLAVKTEETGRFVTTGEQYDTDMASLLGVTLYCWAEDTIGGGTRSFVAGVDTATGAVKLSTQSILTGAVRPRLIATASKIYLFYIDQLNDIMYTRQYDPAGDLSSPSEDSVAVTLWVAYDIALSLANTEDVVVAIARNANYNMYLMDGSTGFSSATVKTGNAVSCISVSHDPTTTTRICVSRDDTTTTVESDILNSTTFADVAAATAVGTAPATILQITSAYNDSNTCSVFWSTTTTPVTSANFITEWNTTDNAGSTGSEATLVRRASIASHAFSHDGSIYLWLVFGSASDGILTAQLQNTYFLYRSDGHIAAKAVNSTAGGHATDAGALPSVTNTSGNIWEWCGIRRRIIPLGEGQKGYAAQSPQQIVFTFDHASARRTTELGAALYIAGGFISQFDGSNLVEVGFHNFPYSFGASASGSGGNPNGKYNYIQVVSWYNVKGEFERSTTATITEQTVVNEKMSFNTTLPLHITAKTGAAGEVAIEYFRQIAAAAVNAPYFLINSKDPSATGDNGYVENDPTSSLITSPDDDMDDDDLIKLEPFPENGGLTLANLPPPPATIIASTQDRVILAGIPANPHRVVYSRLRGDSEIASFNEILFVDLPPAGGPISGIDFLNETMIAFKETAIYALSNDGFDNAAGGVNYGPGRVLSSDLGAISAEGIVLTPKGLLYKSSKGWYLLNHGWQSTYVGGAVADFDDDTIVSAHSMESQHQVRIVTDSRTLMWDYLVNEWSVWGISSASACMFGGLHHYVNSTEDGLLAQAATHSGAGDLPALDVETGWIALAGHQGYKLVRGILVLGEYLAACDMRVRIAYDYAQTAAGATYVDDKTWTISPTTVNGPLQLRVGPSRPKCQAIKVRITAQAVGAASAPITAAFNLTALSLDVALKKTAVALPATQKQ